MSREKPASLCKGPFALGDNDVFFPVVMCEQLHWSQCNPSLTTSLGPVYTKRQRQLCNKACDSVLIKNNGVIPEWGLQPIFKRL